MTGTRSGEETREAASRLHQYEKHGSSNENMSSSKEFLQRSSESFTNAASERRVNNDTAYMNNYSSGGRPSAICQLVTSVLCCTLLLFAVILFNHIYSNHEKLELMRDGFETRFEEQDNRILLLQTTQQVYMDRLRILEESLQEGFINNEKVINTYLSITYHLTHKVWTLCVMLFRRERGHTQASVVCLYVAQIA